MLSAVSHLSLNVTFSPQSQAASKKTQKGICYLSFPNSESSGFPPLFRAHYFPFFLVRQDRF